MNKKTFDIYKMELTSESDAILPDDFSQIDDLIAPSIQILNRKGYTTEWSCSCHSLLEELHFVRGPNFGVAEPWKMSRDEMIERANAMGIKRPWRMPKFEIVDCGLNAYRSYILFAPGISLPSLPPRFFAEQVSDGRVSIERHHNVSDDFFERSRNILDAMEELYRWALALHDFEGV